VNKRTAIATLLVLTLALPMGAATITLQAGNGQYISDTGSLSGTPHAFTIVDANGQCVLHTDVVSLRTSGGKYLGIDSSGNLVATATAAGVTEKFTIRNADLTTGGVKNAANATLVASNNSYVCVQGSALRATCSSPVNETYFKTGISPVPAALSATASIASPTAAGKAVYLKATPQNGLAGTTKYTYKVTNTANNTVVLPVGGGTPAEQTEYQVTWTPSEPGTYRLDLGVVRYCNNVKVDQAAALISAHQVAGVTFTAPAQGTSVTPGSSTVVTWTPVNLSGTARLAYYNGATYVADITPAGTTVNMADGQYSWNVPSNLAGTSQGKIVITSTANTAMNFASPLFTVSAPTSTLAWTWTTRLTPAHFAALGVTLDATQSQKLNNGTYTIESIVNSKTDRLYDSSKCSSCHSGEATQAAGKYRPLVPVYKTHSHYVRKTDAQPTIGYRWSAPSGGVVSAFVASPIGKPDMLEKLFQRWLKEGGL
jgi:hypothetical protein